MLIVSPRKPEARQANGLTFSCRKHTTQCRLKPNDLAREAFGWNFHDRKRSLFTRETVSERTVSQKRLVGPQLGAGLFGRTC
jgi:hypothetical protein